MNDKFFKVVCLNILPVFNRGSVYKAQSSGTVIDVYLDDEVRVCLDWTDFIWNFSPLQSIRREVNAIDDPNHMEETKDAPERIDVPLWWSNGHGVIIRRDCLPPHHPENTYNYIKHKLKLRPEDYGVGNPWPEICESCGRPIDE